MTTTDIRNAYAYLSTVSLLRKKDESALTIALNRIKAGQPLSASLEKDVSDILALYRGLTAK